ncbi:RND multidrug efflux transporter [Enhygromyxa salina]|uniref:RND multidrug efflux transporter n=1 Tax=Enhygromyxa salina TaxID=215803 RepID=A0A0C1ZMA1_9BACT|nr:efflux RND transporter permease subunit [Enhygromyxa salina]KIG12073.1 RND multidrug efflux transporter [Enhygromyxa salina]
MKLVDVSVKRPVFAAMLIMALVVFGMFAYPRLGVDLYPAIDFPVVSATVVYPGADPMTMESKIAEPIEEAIQGVAGIKRMTSRNLEGVTVVVIEFELEVKSEQALQEVKDKIAAIERDLPPGIDPPVIQRFDTGSAPIASVALASNLPASELTRIADKIVKQQLQQIPGVGSIDLIGGRERQIRIEVDPADLVGYGLAVDDVAQALRSQSLDLPAGHVTQGTREFTVTTRGEVHSVAEITDIVITGVGGAAVRIGDVAEVVDDMEEARSASFLNGQSGMALVVRKKSGANTVEIADRLREEMIELGPQLEKLGVTYAIPNDNSSFIRKAIEDVQLDLLVGAGLTVLIIFVFLHDWRATLISALAIPTSVIGTFAAMNFLGFTLNNITMLAMSLSIGILVDDAIVVIENIYRHNEELGKPRMQAAREATNEIAFAVIATTLSIVAVFVPVAYMSGIIGRFFYEFGITVSVAVLISMLVSFTLTPMMSARFMKQSHGVTHRKFILARAFDRGFLGFENAYVWLVRKALRWPWLTVGAALGTLALSVVVVSQVPGEFIPAEDRGEFAISIEMPTGTSLEATSEIAEAVAADVRENLPGVRDTFTTVGAGAAQVSQARINVALEGARARSWSQAEGMAWVRERLADLAEQDIEVGVEMIDPFGGEGFRQQQIQFTIRGSDMDKMVRAADALAEHIGGIEGFVDVDTTYTGGKPELAIEIDRERAADLGVPVAQIAASLRSLMAADPIGTLKDGGDVYDIVVQLPRRHRDALRSLDGITIRATTGQLVDLANVVHIVESTGPSEIERQSRQRQIVVLADLDGLPLAEAMEIVEQKAAEVVPPELDTGWIGNAEMMEESFAAMLAVLGLAAILVYMILAAQFDSFTQPLVIMVSLPLSVIGAFGGIWVSGMTLNIFSFIGVIMLMGLVTKAAILLVDFANEERKHGATLEDALAKAGRVRLRPIFMTAAATVFGMLPIALALSEGGETRAPMAVCVIGGMITSTLLTLVVIPSVYLISERMVARLSGVWRLFGGAPEQPEPAEVPESSDAPSK